MVCLSGAIPPARPPFNPLLSNVMLCSQVSVIIWPESRNVRRLKADRSETMVNRRLVLPAAALAKPL
jgi:hypothetical protein